MIAYRLATYFAIVSEDIDANELREVHSSSLKQFLEKDIREMIQLVVQEHRSFGAQSDNPEELELRIKHFEECVGKVREELRKRRSTAPAIGNSANVT